MSPGSPHEDTHKPPVEHQVASENSVGTEVLGAQDDLGGTPPGAFHRPNRRLLPFRSGADVY